LGKIQCEGKNNKQKKKNLRNLKFRRTDQKPEFETSQNINKMKYVGLPTGNKPKHSNEKMSLTEKCQHVGRICLNVNAEKRIVNSDFNLKLGKIQCEGKINKQTQKKIQKSKFAGLTENRNSLNLKIRNSLKKAKFKSRIREYANIR